MSGRGAPLLDRLLPMPLAHVVVEHLDDEAAMRRRRVAVTLMSLAGAACRD